MAEVTIPAPTSRTSWLDRPVLPTWQRLAALSINWELLAYTSLLLAGFALRIFDVGSRAMHHDESLHSYYSWKLYAGQGYAYDPLMHGPFQFEFVALFYLLFGANDFSARLLAVVLGTALIGLPYFLRKHLTRSGALVAALMITVSPAFVYFSRFIRDDMYLACFSLILFIALMRYLEDHRARYLYIAACAMALAMASMEAAYITFFIFGTFLIFEGLREFFVTKQGPVLSALRATSLDVWLTSLSIFIAIIVLLYSTFFTNPYGIWDTQHALCLSDCFSLHPKLNPSRQDILGGLTYWQAQQGVRRGDQPWFYYLLVMPLYEQLALVFGLAGLIFGLVKRTLARTFLVWWTVMSFAVYSWAGEKMPWLVIHIALPLILLGGLFLGAVLQSLHRRLVAGVVLVFVLLLSLEIHSTFVLNFVDGANPTEMLIYVQSSQDVPHVVGEISALSQKHFGGTSMPIGLDNTDVGGWPFTWYLRDYPRVTQTSSFNGPQCNGQYCPVLLLLGPTYDKYKGDLLQHYVPQKYRWNWWFPEDYKSWFPEHWGNISQSLQGKASLTTSLLGTQDDWSHLWNWLIYRRPFGDLGARDLYMLVRRDLVPGAAYYPTTPATTNVLTPSAPSLAVRLTHTMGAGGASGSLAGPRGVAAAPNGNLYVADTLNHRIVVFSARGKRLLTWGTAGTGPGQFNLNASPQSLDVGPDGNVYVADTWNQRIQVFSAQGQFIRQWGGGPIGSAPGQFYGPRAVTVARSGRVYVADTGNKRIQIFTRTGEYVSSFGTAGSGPGQFQEPSAVAIGPSGTVFVADFWNQRIQAFTPTGTYVRSWPVPDWTPQSYDEPYLAVDSVGHVFASDPQRQQILEFDLQGHTVGSFGAGQLSVPIGVTVLPHGQVVVADATSNHVYTYLIGGRQAARGVAPHRTITNFPKKP